VTINNLLPERFDTDRQQFMAKRAVAREGISYEEARARQVASIVEMQRRLSGIAELL
jgi:3-oxoacyl-[acyl-carrier protein] reductase